MITMVRRKSDGRIFDLVQKHRNAVWLDTYEEKPTLYRDEPVIPPVADLARCEAVDVLVEHGPGGSRLFQFQTYNSYIRDDHLCQINGPDGTIFLPLAWAKVELNPSDWEPSLIFTIPKEYNEKTL